MSHVVYYDGFCNLCSATVQWMIRNDRRRHFSFQPLDMHPARAAERGAGGSVPAATVILEVEGKRYERSTAAIRIALGLRFPWPLLGLLYLIPRFLRDPVYELIARHRYRWFGRRNNCYVPGT